MNLFHETENKYYELLTRLLMSGEKITDAFITECWDKYIVGERDFEIEDSLFIKKEYEGTVLEYDGQNYVPVLDASFNIRMNQIELQAAKNLLRSSYSKHFLSDSTYQKLAEILKGVAEEWVVSDVIVKNQYSDGVAYFEKGYEAQISIVVEAIRNKKPIVYDNAVVGKYQFVNREIFPIRIEYSYLNDTFRICGYDEQQKRFIKLNLSSMANIALVDDLAKDWENEYKVFLKDNTKKIVLDVEPTGHVIERCFRIFSFYDRRAIFSKDENRYRLEISYLKYDENEVIRDVLSLGSSVVVIEPKKIQKQVYDRICKAYDRYVL